jgi:sulfur carrier protein
MKIILHHPKRIEEVKGPKKVYQLLNELDILPETVLVVLKKEGDEGDGELLTPEDRIADDESVEVRPVISGGAR